VRSVNETPGHHRRHPHGDPDREHRAGERRRPGVHEPEHATQHTPAEHPHVHVAHRKRALRERVLARRDRLSAAARRAHSARVFEHLVTLPELTSAAGVMCFVSFGSEVDTAPLVRWCLDQGKRVALPRIVGRRHMEAFWVTDPAADLESGSYGIREPRAGLPQASPETIDLIVVPGSAFDRSGDRMGYGGGFYDTFLPRLRPRTPRVAIAFELQLIDDVPEEDHDLGVDVLVTERGVLRCARRDGEGSGCATGPAPPPSS
jgi:5-formyltetrahydrofolate cyclo-ligase